MPGSVPGRNPDLCRHVGGRACRVHQGRRETRQRRRPGTLRSRLLVTHPRTSCMPMYVGRAPAPRRVVVLRARPTRSRRCWSWSDPLAGLALRRATQLCARPQVTVGSSGAQAIRLQGPLATTTDPNTGATTPFYLDHTFGGAGPALLPAARHPPPPAARRPLAAARPRGAIALVGARAWHPSGISVAVYVCFSRATLLRERCGITLRAPACTAAGATPSPGTESSAEWCRPPSPGTESSAAHRAFGSPSRALLAGGDGVAADFKAVQASKCKRKVGSRLQLETGFIK